LVHSTIWESVRTRGTCATNPWCTFILMKMSRRGWWRLSIDEVWMEEEAGNWVRKAQKAGFRVWNTM
jgi:hypothetical protein